MAGPDSLARYRIFSRRWAIDCAVACACGTLIWAFFLEDFGPADLWVFLHAARSIGHGASPYVDPSSPLVWSGHTYVYPYVTAWVFMPLTSISLAAAGVVYYVLSVAAMLGGVRLVAGPRAGLVPVVVALTAEPVVRALQLGTLNPWLFLGLAVGWRHRRRASSAVAALTVVIVAKLFLLPMVVWFVLTRRWRAAALTTALTAGVVLAGCAMADLSVKSFARMLAALSAHEAPHSSSVTALLDRVGLGSTMTLVGTLLIAGGVVAGGWARYRGTGNEAFVFCACLLASLALSPIVWSHYFLLLLLIPLTMQWRPRSLLIFLCVTWLVAAPGGVPSLRLLHPFTGAGWMSGGIVVACVLTWKHVQKPSRTTPAPAPRG